MFLSGLYTHSLLVGHHTRERGERKRKREESVSHCFSFFLSCSYKLRGERVLLEP